MKATPEAIQAIEAEGDMLSLAVETFEIDELSDLDVNAPEVKVSLCSSTCSSSCG